jgi:hypothetical protein
MCQRTKNKRSQRRRATAKQLESALAIAIREIGALLETCADPEDLRHASRVLRSLAYIATLQANARQYRDGGSIDLATQHEHAIERVYANLPTSVKW